MTCRTDADHVAGDAEPGCEPPDMLLLQEYLLFSLIASYPWFHHRASLAPMRTMMPMPITPPPNVLLSAEFLPNSARPRMTRAQLSYTHLRAHETRHDLVC